MVGSYHTTLVDLLIGMGYQKEVYIFETDTFLKKQNSKVRVKL